MITKIKRIKNLGLVFADFSWNPSTPDFKRFNIIYGWNGSGKTTLSRLFSSIAESDLDQTEFEMTDEAGAEYKTGQSFPQQIRVFNQDYIQKNVEILKSHANSISILLGEENKDLAEQIKKDEVKLNGDSDDPANVGKAGSLYAYSQKKKRKEKDRENKFTEIAAVIGAAMGGGSASRSYRRPNAEKDFASLGAKSELNDSVLDEYTLTLKQEVASIEKPVALSPVQSALGQTTDPLILLGDLFSKAQALLTKTAQTETIIRLRENPDISKWVEEGTHLHKKHNSNICEYCGNLVSSERIAALAGHFNDADRSLKAEIEILIEQFRKIYTSIDSIDIPDTARFYKELRTSIDSSKESLTRSKGLLLGAIKIFAETLKSKRDNTDKTLVSNVVLDPAPMASEIESLNEIIGKHNQKTKDFEKVREVAANKLKAHYLSTIFDTITSLDKDLVDTITQIDSLTIEVAEIQKRIEENKSKISSTHKACAEINAGLETFLGRKELHFEPDVKETYSPSSGESAETTLGYHILRGSEPALYLSEGEKTAIAFVYFVVHLKDGQFPLENGLVVVDDPISSLDSNSVYQAFSFLKNAVKDCGQVFIFTHSFDFLRLLLNWRKNVSDKKETSYFMIKNDFSNGNRLALIENMDKELQEYESEYHYLFHLLKTMRDSQNESIEKAYPVPNIARKVWESFLMFRVPNGRSPYSKMEVLKKDGYSSQKLDAIYKFTNDQSHITGAGFDPALVPETKKVIGEILEMMETIAPEHFRIINSATS